MAYNNYANYQGIGQMSPSMGNTQYQNAWGNQNGNGYNQAPSGNYGWNNMGAQQQMQPQQQYGDGKIFVHGRAGAEAFQMPNGVNVVTLWDDEVDRFYVKGYDNNGRPRVLADNDFQPHVEPEQPQFQNIDLSGYAKIDDIKQIVSEAIAKLNVPIPDMTRYITRDEYNQGLSELSVGSGGRVVRINESNA